MLQFCSSQHIEVLGITVLSKNWYGLARVNYAHSSVTDGHGIMSTMDNAFGRFLKGNFKFLK